MLPAMQEDMSVYIIVYTVESTVTWRCLVYESLVGNPQGCCAANDFAAHQGSKVREALLKKLHVLVAGGEAAADGREQ